MLFSDLDEPEQDMLQMTENILLEDTPADESTIGFPDNYVAPNEDNHHDNHHDNELKYVYCLQ